MTSTVFTDQITPIPASWLNDVNGAAYSGTGVNTPAGGVTSVTQQAAINELDTKKISAPNIHAATSKVTPVDADELPIIDSATSFTLARLTFANLKATLVTYLSTLTSIWAISTTGNAATATTAATLTTPRLINGVSFSGGADIRVPANTAITGCTQAAGALTFTMGLSAYDFRSPTLNNGTITTVSGTPANLVLPSGGTLGVPTTTSGRIIRVLLNNAGVMEQAIINQAGGVDLSETGVISTTSIDAASIVNNVFYSTVARTNVAYRVDGAIDAVNTAGAWSNPTFVQGAGGQAFVDLQERSMVRLNTANGYGSTNTMIRRFTNVVTNIGSAITYTDSATLGALFTINISGIYSISYNDNFSVGANPGLSLNTSSGTTAIANLPVAEILAVSTTAGVNYIDCVVFTGYLVAGSLVRAHTSGASTGIGTTNTQFTITRNA